MYRFVVLVSLLTLTWGNVVRKDGRIVGGEEVNIIKHPYAISLRYKSCSECPFSHVCGGNIINRNTVLTAAHCLYNRIEGNFMIVAGTNYRNGVDGYVSLAEKAILHGDYNPGTKDSDIAIVILGNDIPLNNYTTAAIDLTSLRPTTGTVATVVGWGTVSEGGTSSNNLRDVNVPVVSAEKCQSSYGSMITETMLCAGYDDGGRDACQYDSGGGLIKDNQLVGIISWGIGCARPDYPGVYADVAHFKSWIEETINENI